MRANHFSAFIASAAFVCLVTGCITRDAGGDETMPTDSSDASPAVDGPVSDDAQPAPQPPAPQRKPLGSECVTSADCASDFCADQVCCATLCDAQCYSCNQAGALGSCAPLDGTEDLSASVTCVGANVCSTDSSGVAACKLRDGEACVSPSECAGGACRTYFVDQDRDGYGTSGGGASISRCDTTANPPSGFTVTGGDCCDLDPAVKPAVSGYFTSRNACGNYDWNCRNGEEREGTRTCPTAGNQAIACGQACSLVIKGSSGLLFVQGCR